MIFSVGKVGMLPLVLEPLELMPTDTGNSNDALHTGCSSTIHAYTVEPSMCVFVCEHWCVCVCVRVSE